MEILFFREDAPREEEMNRLHEVYGADVEVTWLQPLWVDDAAPVGDPRIFAEDSRIYTDANVHKLVKYMRE